MRRLSPEDRVETLRAVLERWSGCEIPKESIEELGRRPTGDGRRHLVLRYRTRRAVDFRKLRELEQLARCAGFVLESVGVDWVMEPRPDLTIIFRDARFGFRLEFVPLEGKHA